MDPLSKNSRLLKSGAKSPPRAWAKIANGISLALNLVGATALSLLVPSHALGEGLIVDKFNCILQVTDGAGQTHTAAAKLSAARTQKLDSGGQMLYETPGQELIAKLTLPSGFAVQLQMQYTFKRPANNPADWGLHTCLGGTMTDLAGRTSHWACPEYYVPVSEHNGIPLFDGIQDFDHNFELDGHQVKLSCILEQTIS